MTLDQLQAFVAVVEHGSIRAAARSLSMAQSGLTQQIKRLEASLGSTLFARGNNGILMTQPGELLLARARIILGECERASQEFQFIQGNHIGSVTVGVSFEAFARLIPPVLSQFRSRFPKVKVHLASGPSSMLLSGIREGRLDFAVTLISKASDMTDLSSTRIDRAEPTIACRKGHPLEGARSVHELASAEWVNTRPPGKTGIPSNRLVDLFEEAGIGIPKIVVTVESLFDTLLLISKTDYLFLAPRVAVQQGAFSELLSEVQITETLPEADLCLIQRTAVPPPPIAKQFGAMLISYARLARNNALN
jgi:LysR family transcriptional regulator, regulator of abg operon